MQALAEMIDIHPDRECKKVPFMPDVKERELICRAASGDVQAKLQLVKGYLDLVIELAASHTLETGKQFSQMVRIGILAVIKAADSFHRFQQMGFTDHVRYEIAKAMAADEVKEVNEIKTGVEDIWRILEK